MVKSLPLFVRAFGVARAVRPFFDTSVIASFVKSLIAPSVVVPLVAAAFEKLAVPKLVSVCEGASRIHSAELNARPDELWLWEEIQVLGDVRSWRVTVTELPECATSTCMWSPACTGFDRFWVPAG